MPRILENIDLATSQAKDAINEVDAVFAKLPDLEDSELDVLANYDIKYHMGQEAVEQE